MASAYIETRKDELHAHKFFEELYSLWQYEQLCDLTLRVGGSEFKVHKLVLVSCSQYFKNMFTEELFLENNRTYVELFEVNVNAFKVILEYFYSGNVTLDQNTVELVLRTADFFGLSRVKSICCEYLLDTIDLNNCVRRYSLGVTFDSDNLKSQAKFLIMHQLDELLKTHEFLSINQDILKEFLTSNIESGESEKMYCAIMEWVKHDLDNRKSILFDLLELIPIEGITYPFYIENMKNDRILRQDFKCTSWLLDNFIERFVNLSVGGYFPDKNLFITSRTTNIPICYKFNLRTNELTILPPRPDVIRFSAVNYKNCIYLITGKADDRNIENSFKYNAYEKKWSNVEVNFERCNSGLCILQDQLYVVGGYNCKKRSSLNTCVCYDFNTEQKYPIAEMKEVREIPGIGVYGNSVYICCGVSNGNNLASIQRYDPREGSWCDVGNYRTVMGYCASTVITNSFYSSQLEEKIVERFDFRTNISEELHKPLGSFGGWITSANEKLFRTHGKGITEYDTRNNQWLTKDCEFDLLRPIIVSWDST